MLLIPNFDLSKKIRKSVIKQDNFFPFLQLNCSNFRLKNVKSLRLTKIVKKKKFEGVLGELEKKNIFRDNLFITFLQFLCFLPKV